MPSSHPLGDYLRARRELLLPGDVGLPEGRGVRRVPGLRRSEVAALAGISTEYYIKLEQGQEVHPTAQVLQSLSSALKLDATATSYLRTLAFLPERPAVPVPSTVVERTRWLIDSWPMTAAMILDRHNDILATNSLMSALVDGYRPGRNSNVALMLDPTVRDLYLDWEGLSMRSTGLLRSITGPSPDARAREVIAQLTAESARFRQLWNRHDIMGMTEGTHPMCHPVVGELSMNFVHIPLSGTDRCSIFVYYAEPGTRTEEALSELAAGR
jgi:transcriptional regulator with XRE-family HTH domain